jgi:hypothetical protein
MTATQLADALADYLRQHPRCHGLADLRRAYIVLQQHAGELPYDSVEAAHDACEEWDALPKV